jgi:hypothetical protein
MASGELYNKDTTYTDKADEAKKKSWSEHFDEFLRSFDELGCSRFDENGLKPSSFYTLFLII